MMAEITDMYGAGDDAEIVAADIKRPVTRTGLITEFEINGTTVRTVDPNYVTVLEARLVQTERALQELRNEINRINTSMRQRGAEMGTIWRQINNKIDRE
jgi:hypothetical protein